jgi:hypothetical protein
VEAPFGRDVAKRFMAANSESSNGRSRKRSVDGYRISSREELDLMTLLSVKKVNAGSECQNPSSRDAVWPREHWEGSRLMLKSLIKVDCSSDRRAKLLLGLLGRTSLGLRSSLHEQWYCISKDSFPVA